MKISTLKIYLRAWSGGLYWGLNVYVPPNSCVGLFRPIVMVFGGGDFARWIGIRTELPQTGLELLLEIPQSSQALSIIWRYNVKPEIQKRVLTWPYWNHHPGRLVSRTMRNNCCYKSPSLLYFVIAAWMD